MSAINESNRIQTNLVTSQDPPANAVTDDFAGLQIALYNLVNSPDPLNDTNALSMLKTAAQKAEADGNAGKWIGVYGYLTSIGGNLIDLCTDPQSIGIKTNAELITRIEGTGNGDGFFNEINDQCPAASTSFAFASLTSLVIAYTAIKNGSNPNDPQLLAALQNAAKAVQYSSSLLGPGNTQIAADLSALAGSAMNIYNGAESGSIDVKLASSQEIAWIDQINWANGT